MIYQPSLKPILTPLSQSCLAEYSLRLFHGAASGSGGVTARSRRPGPEPMNQPQWKGMTMATVTGISAIADPVIDLVPQPALRDAIRHAFAAEPQALAGIEGFFAMVPEARWSRDLMCTVVGSWKATHLKMLAIYGLSCRLNRLAGDAQPVERAALNLAAIRNAETSYEDLGL